jgi:hypothetical protein
MAFSAVYTIMHCCVRWWQQLRASRRLFADIPATSRWPLHHQAARIAHSLREIEHSKNFLSANPAGRGYRFSLCCCCMLLRRCARWRRPLAFPYRT